MSNVFVSKNVPSSSNEVWKKIILGKVSVNFTFLAGKILLTRLKMQIAREGEKSDLIESCVSQMHDLYQKRSNLPDAQKDLFLINKLT